jgi:PmbA protein
MDALKQKEAFFKDSVKKLLKLAQEAGASQAEAALNGGGGFSLTVRKNDVETIEHYDDQNLSVTVYFGKQKGSASTTDLTDESLQEAVDAAVHIAKFTLPDECAGLPDAQDLAKNWPELDLYHPWPIAIADAVVLAKNIEACALGQDQRIINSEGANLNIYQGLNVYGSSEGFLASTYASNHGLSLGLIAADKEGNMQRDFSFTEARRHEDLWSYERLAQDAVRRTLRRLNPQPLSTQNVPVIFEASIAGSLLGNYLRAVSGGALYRNSSFLLDSLGKKIFPEWFSLYDDPFIPRALGSAPFDPEGVQLKPQYLVQEGIVKTYLLSTYTARKLSMRTTGHASGAYNVKVSHDEHLTLEALIKKMHKGLLVTELMGQGVNLVTGDYSRGATGLWVEHGEVQYPVEEITIAGNLKNIFSGIVASANDIDQRGRVHVGSLLVDRMMLAGA